MTDEAPMAMTEARAATAPRADLLPARQLKTLAERGSFAVDDSTGDKMIAALEGVVDALQARWNALEKVGVAPAMSKSPAGQFVSKHMAETARDAQGLLTQLQAARDEFPTYVEAIKLAKKNYKEREHSSAETFERIRSTAENQG
ncbi:hypothetical protein [Amycolatopsis orientalis]|uniref:hypothetical protein n=1 Tax=Amycolatopsis orientalis TaxID=31958 RepID=UPI0003A3BB9B|nr:hypothetical protein [Amycolatopsis orientalis]